MNFRVLNMHKYSPNYEPVEKAKNKLSHFNICADYVPNLIRLGENSILLSLLIQLIVRSSTRLFKIFSLSIIKLAYIVWCLNVCGVDTYLSTSSTTLEVNSQLIVVFDRCCCC